MEGIITTISFHGTHVTGAYSTINVPERHDNSWGRYWNPSWSH